MLTHCAIYAAFPHPLDTATNLWSNIPCSSMSLTIDGG